MIAPMPDLSRRRFARVMLAAGLVGGTGLSRPVFAAGIKPSAASALVVVDVQNCFVDGGTLPVKGGAQVVPVINRLASAFDNIVITQDWHTPGHASFASTHAGKKPFETTRLAYGTQVLWPDHCVQGTDDAALVKDLKLPTAELIIRKGFHKDVDSYSAFEEADRKTATGLAGYLKGRGINTVFITGLATDFCVAWTAIDARKLGFDTYVIEDATRGIDLNGSLAAAWKDMAAAGVKRIQSADIQTA
jgi:nicotinamidase/pyrazinamidase